MLVLSRSAGQEIVVQVHGEKIVFRVVEARGNVRLGVTANPNVSIDRREVLERIEAGEPRRRRTNRVA